MIAKQISYILVELCRRSDVTNDSLLDMEKRFKALLGCGWLPRGSKNRGQALTNDQIVASVLGLLASQPDWAGHVATIVSSLKPVGCTTDAFSGAATLTDALITALADQTIRDSIVSVRLSVAEVGANSHGLATIINEQCDTRRHLSFVRDEAVSMLQPGGENRLDAELRDAPVSRELILTRRFFQRLAHKIDTTRAHLSPPIDDGAEHNKEEEARERELRLGVTTSSHFLNIGIDSQVTWPREEMLIEFSRYKFVLTPKTKDHAQSIHVDLNANRLSMEEATTAINRFLILLTWNNDQYAVSQDGWSGNPVPVAVPKRNLAFVTADHWIFNRDVPASLDAQRALALYRETCNAEQDFMTSYAVLNYYKILEILYPDSASRPVRDWIEQSFPTICNDLRDTSEFLSACGGEFPADYIYKACRAPVAHASRKNPSDPDVTKELRRLHIASDVMRRLARRFISYEQGVS